MEHYGRANRLRRSLHVAPESKDRTRPTCWPPWPIDAAAVVARYPHKRSALLPLLHLVQSVDGYIAPTRHRVLRRDARPE
jgi:hypothetical protein